MCRIKFDSNFKFPKRIGVEVDSPKNSVRTRRWLGYRKGDVAKWHVADVTRGRLEIIRKTLKIPNTHYSGHVAFLLGVFFFLRASKVVFLLKNLVFVDFFFVKSLFWAISGTIYAWRGSFITILDRVKTQWHQFCSRFGLGVSLLAADSKHLRL